MGISVDEDLAVDFVELFGVDGDFLGGEGVEEGDGHVADDGGRGDTGHAVGSDEFHHGDECSDPGCFGGFLDQHPAQPLNISFDILVPSCLFCTIEEIMYLFDDYYLYHAVIDVVLVKELLFEECGEDTVPPEMDEVLVDHLEHGLRGEEVLEEMLFQVQGELEDGLVGV